MKEHNDYVLGRHHRRLHFAVGFVVGAGIGAGLSSWFFDSSVARLIVAAVLGGGFGLCCGRYGERAWERLAAWWRNWWWLPL